MDISAFNRVEVTKVFCPRCQGQKIVHEINITRGLISMPCEVCEGVGKVDEIQVTTYEGSKK